MQGLRTAAIRKPFKSKLYQVNMTLFFAHSRLGHLDDTLGLGWRLHNHHDPLPTRFVGR